MSKSTTILDVLGTAPAVSSKMRGEIQLWTEMYENRAEWLHSATEDDPLTVVSLGIPAMIASEKARLATLELKSEITAADGGDSERAEFLNKAYQEGVLSVLRTQSEYAIAKGGIAITPYIVGEEKNRHFAYDYTQAEKFIPLSFDTAGTITDAAFLIKKETDDSYYYRLERQTYINGELTISNRAFRSEKTGYADSGDILDIVLGEEVNLSDVPEWENIAEESVYKDVDRVFFSYMKMPNANTADSDSALGVSGFSRAAAQIQEADELNALLRWEMNAGKMAIEADTEAFRDGDDIKLPSPVYRLRDTGDRGSYNAFSPALRDQSYINALEYKKAEIESLCGLSRGTFSRLDEGREITAYQLKMQRQQTYSEIATIQAAIEKALKDVIYIMDAYCSIYGLTGGKAGEYEVSFEWDDSVIVDTDTELKNRLTLVNEGIDSRVETRMWYHGETQEQAEEAIRKIDAENAGTAAARLENIEVI